MFSVIKEQAAIYNSESKRILVNAGPGAGKTVVSVCTAVRSVNQIIENSNRDAKVLIVSLTNSAADNVKAKSMSLLQDKKFKEQFSIEHSTDEILSAMKFSTLHSFALSMLMKFGYLTSGSSLSIVENAYISDLLDEILSQVKPEWKNDKSKKKDLYKIQLAVESGRDLKELLNKKHSKYRSEAKLIDQVLAELNQRKNKHNTITFDDMVLSFVELLKKKKVKKKIRRLFPVILVDEFQDVSWLHWKLLMKLVGKRTYLICLGDDGQTIYTWNGASFNRFNHFRNKYPEGQVFCLTQNLRSTRALSSLSGALMDQSHFVTSKKLSAKIKGKKPQVILNPDQLALCTFVIEEINRLHQKGVPYDDIAVIYRHHGDGFKLREHLQSKIPFKLHKDKSKRDRPIIRFVFSIIRILESNDIVENDWNEVLMKVSGVGKSHALKIIPWLKEKDPTDVAFPHTYKFVTHLEQLLLTIKQLREPKLSNIEKLDIIFQYAKKLDSLGRSIEHHIKPTLYKLASKGKLSDIIPKYIDQSYPLYYPVEENFPYSDSYVTLSTVHGVKGSEFESVFYLGSDNFYYEKYGLFRNSEKRENELQVMNVAVTRPTKRLYLLFPISKKTWKNHTDTQNPYTFLNKVEKKHLRIR